VRGRRGSPPRWWPNPSRQSTFTERNITDAVSAVNFDYRGFDTLGEEFILFFSVLGSLLLLRMAEERKEEVPRDAAASWRNVGPGDATRLWILVMIAPKVVFGIYIVVHGQRTPGGGFQGGVGFWRVQERRKQEAEMAGSDGETRSWPLQPPSAHLTCYRSLPA
jgi:Domain related to MnhB subunit of Na+/H+ antiporter